MLLAFGLKPYDLMLQLLAKKEDPFSGGRAYYCHPSLKDADKPKIPHQSSATGMQAIPATGVAMGFMRYQRNTRFRGYCRKNDITRAAVRDRLNQLQFVVLVMLQLLKVKLPKLFKWLL